LGSFLIFISRRNASSLDMRLLDASNLTGNLVLVYREAFPLLWVINRFSILFVIPVYNVLSWQRKIYTIQSLFAGAAIDSIIAPFYLIPTIGKITMHCFV
jgi:hypothetical protein